MRIGNEVRTDLLSGIARPACMIAFILMLSLSLAAAQSTTPKLSFGSIQPSKIATVAAGATAGFDLYFFVDEQYGTETAHITLSQNAVPSGWTVSFDPALYETIIAVDGTTSNIKENLYAEPRPALASIPAEKEAGISYMSANGKGYLQARKARVLVSVPKDAEQGKPYGVSVSAVAKYYGGTGNVLFSQSRDFSYTVNVARTSESPAAGAAENVTPVSNISGQGQTTGSGPESAENGTQIGSASFDFKSISESLPGIAFVVVLVVIVVAAVLLVKRASPVSQRGSIEGATARRREGRKGKRKGRKGGRMVLLLLASMSVVPAVVGLINVYICI